LLLPSIAASETAPRSARFATASVDFGDPAAVKALYAGLRQAAAKVCHENRNLRIAVDSRRCHARALDGAVRQVNHPALTAAHQGATAVLLASN
jgi:UrcA family protein